MTTNERRNVYATGRNRAAPRDDRKVGFLFLCLCVVGLAWILLP